MAAIGLNLPTDITWERICVTDDMMDRAACDDQWPPLWHTSIAVFKYVPADEYQPYADQRLIYYKVTATLTAYQPQDKEIQGAIDWTKLSAQEIADFESKLKTQRPCSGAMLQVTVAPAPGQEANLGFDQYPYFLDVQPKQRALYEQASDSQEIASRSLESLQIKKGAGASSSTEVLDVDQGYSVGVQAQAQGYGVGVNVSRQGQWGSKELGQQTSENVRTTDSLREQRDTVSHSTQISQLYNLLQAYHLGTNRLMFYVAPRPHVLEQPSGLINGPRAIDGIQELFTIVCLPKTQGDPCLSVRLDTSHLADEELYDYDRSVAALPLNIDLQAAPPKKDDADKVGSPRDVDAFEGQFMYDCYDKVVTESQTTPDKPGYVVESVDDLLNDSSNGSSDFQISADNKTVTLTGTARGHACFRNQIGDSAYQWSIAELVLSLGLSPHGQVVHAFTEQETKNERGGSVSRHLLVHLRSEKATIKVGDKWTLLVTTRGLCCCGGEHPQVAQGQSIVAAIDLTERLAQIPWQSIPPFAASPEAARAPGVITSAGVPVPMNARQANVLTDAVSQLTQQISSRPLPSATIMSRLAQDYWMRRITAYASKSPHWRRAARTPLSAQEHLSPDIVRKLADAAGEPNITPLHVVGLDDRQLTEATGLPPDQLLRFRLQMLGFPTKSPQPYNPQQS